MASGLNKVILIGNLGKDPEIRTLENGKSRVTVSIATSEIYKNKAGEKINNTEWHNVVFWTPLAEIVDSYLKKGSKIYIEGKLATRSYEKDGVLKYVTEIVARELLMLDSRSSDGGYTRQDKKESDVYQPASTTGDDHLPF